MVMGEVMLTFDIGTQSLRGMLMNAQGEIEAFVQKKYEVPYYSKNPGWAEQSPNFYYETLCEVSKELKGKSESGFEQVIGVTVTAIRDTCLCLDEKMEPLRDIIVWPDSRETNSDTQLSPLIKTGLKVVGMDEVLRMQHRVTKANWIMDHEPEIWKKTAKFVMLPTYINYKMTGQLKDSAANQIAHIPFDYKNRKWQKKNDIRRKVVDIPEHMLCELVNAEDIIGAITLKASEETGIPAGLVLYATGSDKGCETLGLSVIHKHQAALSFGTTATVQFATKEYFEPKQFLPSYPAVPNDLYNPEIQIYRGYWLISWFKKEFAAKECVEALEKGCSPEEILNARLREVPPGCEGLILQPFWTPGVVTPNAKGAIIGFCDAHSRIHVYRAIIEGIGFALMDGLYSMQKRGKQQITEIFVAGGGAQSDEICQITANMFGLKVKRIQTHEASGLGASMVGFVACGKYRTYEEAIHNMVRVSSVFEPDMEEYEIYQELYHSIYKKIYGRLLPLYKKIKTITRRKENE